MYFFTTAEIVTEVSQGPRTLTQINADSLHAALVKLEAKGLKAISAWWQNPRNLKRSMISHRFLAEALLKYLDSPEGATNRGKWHALRMVHLTSKCLQRLGYDPVYWQAFHDNRPNFKVSETDLADTLLMLEDPTRAGGWCYPSLSN